MAYSQANTRLRLLDQLETAARMVVAWDWSDTDDEPRRDVMAMKVVLDQLDAMSRCPHCGGSEPADG